GMMASPSFLNHCKVISPSSSIKPTIATVGVGSTTPAGLSLYRETLPPTTGVLNARHASAIPSTASRNCQKFSGLYGLPKFKLSVTASGRAPEQVRFRAASATAMRPPSRGSSAQYNELQSVTAARILFASLI